MKKYLLIAAAALMAFAACEKDPENGGEIIDDGGNGGNGNTETVSSLNGSNYYPILMDAVTFEKIKSKVVADLRAQDGGDAESTRPLYIWSGYSGAEAAGLNFYGNAEGFTCFSVNGGVWSGFGVFLKKTDPGFAKMAELAKGGYYLHFALKGPAGVSHCIYPAWGGKEYRVSVGDGAKFADGDNTYDFIAPISNGGKFVANEWNEYEIALSDTGLDYTAPAAEEAGQNIFCGLSGSVAGTLLQIDAAFFYKK
ncbi:MAG: hypothetical protein K6A64_04335 [Bacteroidales bacterium]|jgi:hypothetical protein|nr:hypothetical protein [Bacteroidales bacterium]